MLWHAGGDKALRAALLERDDQLVQALTEKLMMYAIGRELEYSDMPPTPASTPRGRNTTLMTVRFFNRTFMLLLTMFPRASMRPESTCE